MKKTFHVSINEYYNCICYYLCSNKRNHFVKKPQTEVSRNATIQLSVTAQKLGPGRNFRLFWQTSHMNDPPSRNKLNTGNGDIFLLRKNLLLQWHLFVNKSKKHETSCCSDWSLVLVKQVMSERYFEDKDKRAAKADIKPEKGSARQRKMCPYILSGRYIVLIVDRIVIKTTN